MRCFLAIELPETVRTALAGIRERLPELDRMVRWTRPEQLHLTLKFFAQVPEGDLSAVISALQESARSLSPFSFEVAGLGCFPPSGPPRVLWAGIAGPPPELIAVQAAFEEACTACGYPPENRAFKPHLTLARTRDGVAAHAIRPAIQPFSTTPLGRAEVVEVILFQSILEAGGATHVPLLRTRLGNH